MKRNTLIGVIFAIVFSGILLFAPPAKEAQAALSGNVCRNVNTVITAAGMDSSQSFSIDTTPGQNYGLATVFLSLTDANTSITSFQMQCFGNYRKGSDDFKLQSCSTASGVCTSDDATWTKASPGTSNWLWRVDIEGLQSIKCTMSVAGGTGASADLLTANLRLCTKG